MFHNKRHPDQMGEREAEAFLTSLAVKDKIGASTQNQALGAILFLYRYVLKRELAGLSGVVRARMPELTGLCVPAAPARPVYDGGRARQ